MVRRGRSCALVLSWKLPKDAPGFDVQYTLGSEGVEARSGVTRWGEGQGGLWLQPPARPRDGARSRTVEAADGIEAWEKQFVIRQVLT